jgi:hypothetical protein
MGSLMVPSLGEDSVLSHKGLLGELHMVQHQLQGVYENLGDSITQQSAANAHCTEIQRELGFVRQQLDSARKKRECRSKKIKAHFVHQQKRTLLAMPYRISTLQHPLPINSKYIQGD